MVELVPAVPDLQDDLPELLGGGQPDRALGVGLDPLKLAGVGIVDRRHGAVLSNAQSRVHSLGRQWAQIVSADQRARLLPEAGADREIVTQVAARDDLGRQHDREGHPQHDLEPRGEHGVDQRVRGCTNTDTAADITGGTVQ